MRRVDLRSWLREHFALAATVVAAAVLAVVLVPHLGGEFVWDDVQLVRDNPAMHAAGGLWTLMRRDMWGGAVGQATKVYRPLAMVTFWAQARLGTESVAGFRLLNILLHVAVVALFLSWLRARRVGAPAAVIAAFVLALHPSVTEPVMWLSGRHDVMAAGFLVGALAVNARGGRGFVAGALAALAFLCKEALIVAPLLFALEELMLGAQPRRLVRVVPAFVLLGGAIALRRALGIPLGTNQLGVPLGEHLRNDAAAVTHYFLQLATLRNGPTVVSYHPATAATAALVGAVVFIALALLSLLARRGVRGPLLGALWFAIALLPYAIALPLVGVWGNRYAYLPLIGLCSALAFGLDPLLGRLSQRARITLAGPALVVGVIAAVGLSTESRVWHDGLTLFGSALEQAPEDPRALYHVGNEVLARQGCAAALPFFQQAVQHDGLYWDAWHNLAGCDLNLRRFPDARAAAEHAVRLAPHNARSHYNLGAALLAMGRVGDGIVQLRQAVALDPAYAPARDLLAQAATSP